MIRRILHHFTIQIALWGVLVPLTGCAGEQVLLGANDDKSREPVPAPEVVGHREAWYPVIGYTVWVFSITSIAGFWWWSNRRIDSSE